METLTKKEVREAVRRALAEDVGSGDVTSIATVPETARARARVVTREALVVCGLDFVRATFNELSADIRCEGAVPEGHSASAGETILRLTGPARAVLSGERVALNFLQRLSGVATLTAHFVEAVRGTSTRILDTRKTTPGWRRFEKYAVRCGGGTNHRIGLFDRVLIKDNHLATLRDEQPSAVEAAIRRARAAYPSLKVEVEADHLEQVGQALRGGADIILLDNMTPDQLRQAVALVAGKAVTEASGGVRLSTVHAIAESGVDFISVGALTHSAPAVDIALDFDEIRPHGEPPA